MISMPSLCSMRRRLYGGKCFDVLDENYGKVYGIEKYNSFKKEDDEDDEERNRERKLNKRCVTDLENRVIAAITNIPK